MGNITSFQTSHRIGDGSRFSSGSGSQPSQGMGDRTRISSGSGSQPSKRMGDGSEISSISGSQLSNRMGDGTRFSSGSGSQPSHGMGDGSEISSAPESSYMQEQKVERVQRAATCQMLIKVFRFKWSKFWQINRFIWLNLVCFFWKIGFRALLVLSEICASDMWRSWRNS